MIEALIEGDRLAFRLTCAICGRFFAELTSAWYIFRRPDEAQPKTTGQFVHKPCVGGKILETTGVSRAPMIHAPALFQQVLTACPPPPKEERRPTHQHSVLHHARVHGGIKVSWR